MRYRVKRATWKRSGLPPFDQRVKVKAVEQVLAFLPSISERNPDGCDDAGGSGPGYARA
jgi:hypothetical protein